MILLFLGAFIGVLATLIFIELKLIWLHKKISETTKTWRGEE